MLQQSLSHRATHVLLAAFLGVTLLAGCQPQDAGDEGQDGSAPSTETTPGASEETLSPDASIPETPTASVGEAVSVGDLTLRVREAEIDDGRLRVEVDVTNTGDADGAVVTSDWMLLTEDGRTIPPVQAEKPEERGERPIGAGDTEDVKVSFEVPSGFASGELLFKPVHATGSARVRVP